MWKKINIIQFMPYFPPHKWWLETHWEQWWIYWEKNNFWEVYNVISDFNQKGELEKNEKIMFENNIIWYKKNWIENLVVPSLEIINNFPVYKIWDKKYKIIIKYLKEKNINIIITRTRFFLTSLIGWLFARSPHLTSPKGRGINGSIKWIHIEHWSDYVKLNSEFKNLIAKIYDKLIWKWIFKKADKIIWVSNTCKSFINKKFVNKEIEVIYRWLDLLKIEDKDFFKNKFKNKIIIWFVWRLFKWKNIETLIKAFYELDNTLKNKIQIVIVWDWEDFERLKKLDKENKIYFTWWKLFKEALELQNEFDIHFHTSSPGWWLATTLIQAMALEKLIIATPYEWASEVMKNWYNWILLKDDSLEEIKKWLEKWIKIFEEKKDIFWKNAKKVFEKEFNWNENILKYYKLFNER